MTQTNPEQWAGKVLDDVIIAWSEHGHSAGIEVIQAAFAEREASECDVMLKVTWHDAPKPEAKELGRRAKLAEELLLNGEVAQQAEREARLVGVLDMVGKVLPSAAGLDDAPDSKIIACYMNMGELRAIKSTLAALKDRTHG